MRPGFGPRIDIGILVLLPPDRDSGPAICEVGAQAVGRREMYAEMQFICRGEGGSVIAPCVSHISAHPTKIAIPDQVAGNREMVGFTFLERWWFA